MLKRRWGFLGVFVSLVFILAACSMSGTATPVSGSAAGTSTATGRTGQFATPTTEEDLQPTSLASAFANLQDLNSYVITAKLVKVQGNVAEFTGNLDDATVEMVRNGQNRHLTVVNSSGATVFEMWKVENDVYVDTGSGPTKISTGNNVISQFVSMLDVNQSIVESLESKDANYEVVGTASVNGVDTKAEAATYHLQSRSGNNRVFGAFDGAVTSKIWVSQDGDFLMKADLTMSGNAMLNTAGTSIDGTPVGGTPEARGSGQVMIEVSEVNSAPQITAPGS